MRDYCKQHPQYEVALAKPKGRYIKLLGSKNENKEMMKTLKDKICPYPKR